MGGIFVSYRRSDSAGYTGRLMDDLKEQFPGSAVFRDIEAIEAGADFVKAIDDAVGSCSVLLAVIGPRWLAKDDGGKSRLFQENDFVRLEIATALRRDVRVVPVLVEGATMPAADQLPDDLKPLARRQAHEISDRRWEFDVEQLFAVLGKIPGVERRQQTTTRPAPPTPTAAPPQVPPTSTGSGKKIAIGAIGAVAVVVVVGAMLGGNDSTAPEEPPLALEHASSDETAEFPPVPREPVGHAQPVDTAARAPANVATAAHARGARHSEFADDECGRPADVAGTWQLTMQGSAGVFVITQQGEEIHVVEYNGLGQQIGIGNGGVCGNEADITIQNVLWGQYDLTLTFSGRQLNGTFTYMGNTLQLQGVRQS